MRFDKTPVVIISSVEWSAAWQRHQSFAAQWARAGHTVYFVENTGFRDPGLADLSRLARRVGRLARPARSAPPVKGVKLINPVVLPPRRDLSRRLNEKWFVPLLADKLRAAGLRPGALAIAYLPTPTTLQLLDAIEPAMTVYDCVDNFHGHPDPPPDLERIEGELLERSALVLTTSPTLREDKAKLHPNVVELHHGVAPGFFLPARPRSVPPRFCYFGTLWRALDYAPVRALAQAGFEVDLIGPKKEPLPPLPAKARWRPPVPHSELPQVLERYDALLLPYVVDDAYNRGVVPAKIYECLATGRPVLASPLPALKSLGDVLTLCERPADWVEAARSLDEAGRERRVQAARDQGQEGNFQQMRSLIARAWEENARTPEASGSEGSHVRAFVQGFGWIGLLYGLAKMSTLLTQVFAGRLLGPREYGQAHVVLAAAAYLQIVLVLGFPTAIARFVATTENERDQRAVISTALACFLAWAVVSLLAVMALREPLAQLLGLGSERFVWAVGFAFATALYTVISSPLLGLKRFQWRGFAETIYGVSAPAALLLLAGTYGGTYKQLLAALIVSLGAGALFAAWNLRSRLTAGGFDAGLVGPLMRFSAVASLNLAAAALVLAPARLLLNAAYSHHEVGLFSAYFTSTVQVAMAVLYMVTAVVVPIASSGGGQSEGWRAFRRVRLAVGFSSWAVFFLGSVATIVLFGAQYELDLRWAALFSASAALLLVHGVTAALYAARDFSGLGVSVAGSLAAGLANAGLAVALVPSFGITGAAAALIGGFAVGLAVYGAARRIL